MFCLQKQSACYNSLANAEVENDHDDDQILKAVFYKIGKCDEIPSAGLGKKKMKDSL